MEWAVIGVQTTLVGLLLATVFRETSPVPVVGLLLAMVGTAVVQVALFARPGT